MQTSLLICTRKGLWMLHADSARESWAVEGPHFLGNVIHHARLDPRDGRTLLVAASTGHLGPTVYRSGDYGASWQEATTPPAFEKEPGGRSVDHVFWLTPGHASQPGVWYAGSSPQGLFRSGDGGATWQGVDGFNKHPQRKAWCGGDQDGTPDGAKLHSILIDPRDPAHMYLSMSGGGTFESHDAGGDWKPLNRGVRADFYPDPDIEFGHDPHCVGLHPARPTRLYQQNHCGLFRLDEGDARWTDMALSLPKEGPRLDIGLALALHPRDPDTLWTFPMDATTVWPRVSPEGRPGVLRSRDGGNTWQWLNGGLPAEQAWLTVKRQALAADAGTPAGVYFGTTSGEVWGSRDEGESWTCLKAHLPEIYAVEAVEFPE
ncbi:glycosyl hydrolase [Viridibacterium curvum]|uniref:Exo-alpha-sialidase n=1 Tax=Viridibacterium curvum TaxID=1101404 RepID=A0ABP9R9A4_9RHOO